MKIEISYIHPIIIFSLIIEFLANQVIVQIYAFAGFEFLHYPAVISGACLLNHCYVTTIE